MASAWTSRRTTAMVIITALQFQALISVETMTVTSVEGQSFDFICKYPAEMRSNAKYFCVEDGQMCSTVLIKTDKHNNWTRDGRFSLYDNITGAFFLVRVDKLMLQDSRKYWCGVDVDSHPDHISIIQLNVSQECSPVNLSHRTTDEPTHHNIIVDKHNLPLFLTAVMCVAALLFVFLFTLCLLLVVNKRRSSRQPQMSTDYVTMMPGVRPEPEHRCRCSFPDRIDLSDFPPPPPDLCFHFTSKQRESTVTLGVEEYVDVDVSERLCQYQHLDLGRSEEHVYHSLHGNTGPKDRARVKE
ncbi:uncharacterized protein LOC115426786 [Sphaeramia orbicularis]|uniref:uncharacterized protein LOC115426786 n=1 Tax=Sphaeramia orbicularis TaxID=375764 RepID=UPI001180697C|nr:uncharacterized protein LOC115426786 [Sphaeramia orbicularis]